MQITMISNYINHHQIPFSQALFETSGVDYRFIQTEPMEEERIAMGWALDVKKLPYVLFLDRNLELCKRLIAESDLLLVGWMEHEHLLTERLSSNKLTVRISERLYREGQWKAISPRGLLRKYKEHTCYRKKNVYLLCAGGYVASDFSLVKAYPGKMFKFGYFPEIKTYTPKELKKNHPWGKRVNEEEIQLVWAGRFIPLKHPEYVVRLAEKLKQRGYRFHVHFIGGGQMEEELKTSAHQKDLIKEITFYGFLSPGEVRKIMEKCHIHLFTSNHLEGWGAVVNEAMNSGCTEVISIQTGAAPFLLRHGKNGLIYREDSFEDMLSQVEYLLENPTEGERMGMEAYRTITEEWNAKEAAMRLLMFYRQFQEGRIQPPATGPLSVAEVISPGKMYEYMMAVSIKE